MLIPNRTICITQTYAFCVNTIWSPWRKFQFTHELQISRTPIFQWLNPFKFQYEPTQEFALLMQQECKFLSKLKQHPFKKQNFVGLNSHRHNLSTNKMLDNFHIVYPYEHENTATSLPSPYFEHVQKISDFPFPCLPTPYFDMKV